MDAIKCIKERRSIRQYSQKEIDKNIIADIIDCARHSPSARNLQPCEYIAVTEKAMLRKISELATYGPFIKDAAACIIVFGDSGNNHLVEDGCAATQNILLASNAHGIGTCWVAGWQRTYNPQIKELLGIHDDMDLVSIIPLGYAAQKAAQKKKPLDTVLHWEKY